MPCWLGWCAQQYTGQVYREIAMENSDYGGMENVGNTTIMSAMMVPSYYMSDRALMYYECTLHLVPAFSADSTV